MFEGEVEQRMTAVQIQFPADIFAVLVDGAFGDAQFVGDLFAGLVGGNHSEDAIFRRSEIVDAGIFLSQGLSPMTLVDEDGREGGADEITAIALYRTKNESKLWP